MIKDKIQLGMCIGKPERFLVEKKKIPVLNFKNVLSTSGDSVH
jgi:hypothetical protein